MGTVVAMRRASTPQPPKEPRTIGVYKSYNFVDKDPIIDQLRTLLDNEHFDFKRVAEVAGVGEATIYAWLYGLTRRPQFATLQAVFLACGYSLTPTKTPGKANVRQLRSPKK